MTKVQLFKKTDLLIVFILVLIAAAGFFAFRLFGSGEGTTVRISVDGELFGEYPLAEERSIDIPGKIGTCRLKIHEGRADMVYADCPNQICVDHAEINEKGETIVCLPNRVIVEVQGGS